MIRAVGIIYNHRIAEAVALSQQLQSLLTEMGCSVWPVMARDLDRPGLEHPPLDLIITLGGDGTILRAARLAAPHDALVLGVNMGQLGFLAETGPSDVVGLIPAIINDGSWTEERMMLRAIIRHAGVASAPIDGLNDVVVTRGERPRAIRVTVSIDRHQIQTYVADGVIVSTPTGSTAYALAMDGPVVHPELRTLQITPLAPHLTVVRSMVVPGRAVVDLTFHSSNAGVVSVDGQIDVPVADGDSIEVTASPYVARFVRMQARDYFYQTLVNRLSTNIVRGLV